MQATLAHFGLLDGLVNNAGISSRFAIEVGEEADLDRIIAVKVMAAAVSHAPCLPHSGIRVTGRHRQYRWLALG